jgi:hypothetical protein
VAPCYDIVTAGENWVSVVANGALDVRGLQAQYDKCLSYCALRTVFPKVISGLRKPIAIQAAISFNMNLPE